MNEVITILEASVGKEKWDTLIESYETETRDVPPSIRQSSLIQSKQNPNLWRIITHWRSQQDLDQMRSSGETPTGVIVFNTVGADPSLEIWDTKIQQIGPKMAS